MEKIWTTCKLCKKLTMCKVIERLEGTRKYYDYICDTCRRPSVAEFLVLGYKKAYRKLYYQLTGR
jgi:hypothetical protein